MEQKITSEELYSLREAIHLTSFGLKPGDEKASALADELASEIINERIAGLQIQEDSCHRVQLPGFSGTLPQKNKSLFGVLKQPTLKYYKKKQVGNMVYFEPIGNPFSGGIICRYYDPLINYPPWMLPYRFDCVIKNFEDIFVGKQELDTLDFKPQFKEVWEASKNRHITEGNVENLNDYLPEKYEEEAYKLSNKISDELLKNQAGNLHVSPKDDNSKFILAQLHKSRAIYIYDGKRKTEDLAFINFIKDKNYECLEAFLESYKFVNLKNQEIKLMIQKPRKNAEQFPLFLCGEDEPLLLKRFSKNLMPFHAFNIILAFPGRTFTKDELNGILKIFNKNFEEISSCKTLVNDHLQFVESVNQKVEFICRKFNKKDFEDLFFEVTTDTIKYVPFYLNF